MSAASIPASQTPGLAHSPAWRALRLCFELDSRGSLRLLAGLVAEALLATLSLYALARLIDALGGSDAAGALLGVLLAGAASLAFVGLRTLNGKLSVDYSERIGDAVGDLIHERAAAVDLECYEHPRYHDLLSRAVEQGASRPTRILGQLLQALQNLLLLTAMAGLLLSVHWLVLPLLAASLLPGLLLRLRAADDVQSWRERRTGLHRRAWYLHTLFAEPGHAKEMRAYALGEHLRGLHREVCAQLREERAALGARHLRVELLTALFATLGFFSVLALLVLQVGAQGGFGGVATFLVVFQRGQGLLQGLKSNIAALFEDHLYLQSLFEFLELPPRVADPEHPRPLPAALREGWALRGLKFAYTADSPAVLEDIEMRIAPGEFVALVGANGSGKTTLIKLLLRLYDPLVGAVTLEGHALGEYAQAGYRRLVSVVFQDFAHYAASASENIRFGDLKLVPGDARIEAAARLSGAHAAIAALRQGYDSELCRLFDGGSELSTGQWQKLALARALVGDARLLILDEPTSALDPGAEFELFADFRRVLGERAALVISHRLSTVRMADRIYVLDAGRIVEEGDHDSLIARRGRYCELFEKQAHHYR